ncbi:MAG: hypothetical protein IKA36_03875 [Clostridia bacterium]|nr:hypothetical protein [Clostridia bacterium]
MKIIYIKLENFVGVHAAMGKKSLELSFDKIDKPIIQIYGKNRCGKTVLMHELHPFSSINLNGDERSDLSLILPGETGLKNIVYEINGDVYNITHTYKPTPSGNHTVSCSLQCNGEELNPSGGVTVFNNLIEKIMGINKYTFQFIINGTQLVSFANMSYNQRKNLLNKAMGIDIYDKIHKLATDDYRYVSKLLTSLNNTKEFLLSKYDSYENMCTIMNHKQNEYNSISKLVMDIKSRMDQLDGQINVIKRQNVSQELFDVNTKYSTYQRVSETLGSFDDNTYNVLIDTQIRLNNEINSLNNEKQLKMKDIDILYDKKSNIETTMANNTRALSDYNNMITHRDDLKDKIKDIVVETNVTSSSSYLMSMISVAQAVNRICKDIISSLNDDHLVLLTGMIEKGIDVPAFLIQEGSVLMDSEKEKTAVSRIRSMLNNIDGEYVDDCGHNGCIYKKTHNLLEGYFKSYQSVSKSKFTQYDLEQIDHAYKDIMTIKRLINVDISDELKNIFDIVHIMGNIIGMKTGIDVYHLQYLMEEAAKIELRNKYVGQLTEIEKTIESMKSVLINNGSSDAESTLNELSEKIDMLRSELDTIDDKIRELTSAMEENDRKKILLSQVKNINIGELMSRKNTLETLNNDLISYEQERERLNIEYSTEVSRLRLLENELNSINDIFNQYNSTIADIEKNSENVNRYKIIAEATSSTKGKPVIAIRDKVNEALVITNRLLDVMYDNDVEILSPVIDETTFALPFRCGGNTSPDIKYGSQSESALLSLALSLSLSSLLSMYNVPLIDECDGYMDLEQSSCFVSMLQDMMTILKIDQCFIISHHLQPGQYDHVVHTLDLLSEVNK